ncbi:MAG TPA: class I SAM-dependent methyltransferase, partial [Dehalococcoidia bacterium]
MATEPEILLAGEYFLGIQGLAIARSSTSRPSSIRARVDEVKTIVARFDEFPQSLELPVVKYEVEEGYAEWAPSYDGANPAIEREEPVMHTLLTDLPKGDALDAACGTGRHADTLTKLGHRVIGVDTTEAMLAIARDKVPGAEFRRGRLEAIPMDDASVDLVTCALALEHVPDLAPVFREFARVLRPGGHVLISDLHPVTKMTGGVAAFNRVNDTTRGVHFVSG